MRMRSRGFKQHFPRRTWPKTYGLPRNPRTPLLTSRTRTIHISHWVYWCRFCGVWGIDMAKFCALCANTEEPIILRLKYELSVLVSFTGFIVFAPRTLEVILSTNSVNYAEQVISSVRGHYAGTTRIVNRIHIRGPGLSNVALGFKQLRNTPNWLLNLAPIQMRVNRTILHADLRQIRADMDLSNIHDNWTMWALWFAQWKGLMRFGNIIKRRGDVITLWDPSKDTHSGIIRIFKSFITLKVILRA